MLSDTDRNLLLQFQRAKFASDLYNIWQARAAYEAAKANLKQIEDQAIAHLVRRANQEFTKDFTPTSCSTNVERALDIFQAEDDLYALSFVYGDNTHIGESNTIQ